MKHSSKPPLLDRSPSSDSARLKPMSTECSSPIASTDSHLSESSSRTEFSGLQKKKKAKYVAVRKRPRKSSVHSHTLSVTRVPAPIHDKSISPKSANTPKSSKDVLKDSMGDNSPPEDGMKDSQAHEKRPWSLRVSLSLPDEVEPGSPLEKVVRSQKLLSPTFSAGSLPLWEGSTSLSTVTTTSTPTLSVKQSRASSQGNISGPQAQVSQIQADAKHPDGNPFTASALPVSANDRKRKHSEETQAVPAPKNTKMNASKSPSDDVFEPTSLSTLSSSSVISVTRSSVQTPSQHEQPSNTEQSTVILSPKTSTPRTKLATPVTDVFPERTPTPVGYGASIPQKGSAEFLTKETPTVFRALTSSADNKPKQQGHGSNLSDSDPTIKAIVHSTAPSLAKDLLPVNTATATVSVPQHTKPFPVITEKQTIPSQPPKCTVPLQTLVEPKASEQTVPAQSVLASTPVTTGQNQNHVSLSSVPSSKPLQMQSTSKTVAPSATNSTTPSHSALVINNKALQPSNGSTATVLIQAHTAAVGAEPTVISQSYPSTSVHPESPHVQSPAATLAPTSALPSPAINHLPKNSTTAATTSTLSTSTPPQGQYTNTTEDQDVIVVSSQRKPKFHVTSSSLPSYTEAIHHKNSTSLSTVPIAATTAIITTKGRPQELYYAGKIKEHRNISGRRVIAKIAVSARIN